MYRIWALTIKTVPMRCKFLHTALFPTTDGEIIFLYQSLYVILNVKKSRNKRGIVVVHVYSCIKGFDTSDITKLLQQYEVWEANAKEDLVACKEKLLQLQETCYTEPVVEEDDIELWSVIALLKLIIFSVSSTFQTYSLYIVVKKFY